jgi:hypothetical protein
MRKGFWGGDSAFFVGICSSGEFFSASLRASDASVRASVSDGMPQGKQDDLHDL